MKKAGKSNKVTVETLGIKNDSQVYTWMRRYEKEELHREKATRFCTKFIKCFC